MLIDRMLPIGAGDHPAALFSSLDDATMLLDEVHHCFRIELACQLREVRRSLAVLLVRAGRLPCRVASEQTAAAVLLGLLLAIALERGGPAELADLVHLAGDVAPCLLAAEAEA